MNLNQLKLSKSEWESIEIPVSDAEIRILKLITRGYSDVNIKYNETNSLFTFLKLDYSPQLEEFLYVKHFADKMKDLVAKHKLSFIRFSNDAGKLSKSESLDVDQEDKICYIKLCSIVKLKSTEQIRLSRSELINENTTDIYEFVLFKHLEQMLHYKKTNNKLSFIFHYYTLSKLMTNNIDKVNAFLKKIIAAILENFEQYVELPDVIGNSYEIIEKNENLLKYADLQLYEHQKTIFTAVKNVNPKLILYIAPTGTGKTLTPLGLSEGNKIIFVCAARHVGIALARAAISIGKKVAFAFGCSSSSDIRLHYFAAKEFTRDKRTGRIKKVDNTVGDKVEIIICDIRSYLPAMYYMCAFNKPEEIITYWDEPTITMDYENHELHRTIKRNWKNNTIPNVVLSSATLPKLHELGQTISDFTSTFANYKYVTIGENASIQTVIKQPQVYNIVSHDCRKTIPILNNNGYVVMPHYISENYEELMSIVEHCEDNLTLLRYFDLKEASKFILFAEGTKDKDKDQDKDKEFINSVAKIYRNFASVHDITMQSIKLHYLKTLKNVKRTAWPAIYLHFNSSRTQKIRPNGTIDPKGQKISHSFSIGPGVSVSVSNSVGDRLSVSNSVINSVSNSVINSVSVSNSVSQKPGAELSRTISQPNIGTSSNSNISNNNSSAIYVTTKDAYTLTDGPTIFLATDVSKIAKFCIQQANIPASVMKEIQDKIDYNNIVNKKISVLESELEDIQEKMVSKASGPSAYGFKDKKADKKKDKIASDKMDKTIDKDVVKLNDQLTMLRQMIKSAALNDVFIPNKTAHKNKWAEGIQAHNSFTSDVDEDDILSIMMLNDVDDSWKVLLLLGIGVFTEHKSSAYTEIMKRLADTQKLYLIIADSDYIYGTNYQFCHGYLSKDLSLSQEKIIQALGRIGRNNIQQEYSARFRDDEHIKLLFRKIDSKLKPEVINMNILLNSKTVVWTNDEYVEQEEPDEQEDLDEKDAAEDKESSADNSDGEREREAVIVVVDK